MASELLALLQPDLKQLDFAMGGVLEQVNNKTSHSNISSLMAAKWWGVGQDAQKIMVKSCAAFRGRVEAVIKCNGSHIE